MNDKPKTCFNVNDIVLYSRFDKSALMCSIAAKFSKRNGKQEYQLLELKTNRLLRKLKKSKQLKPIHDVRDIVFYKINQN
jgi:hypothetical protein